MSGRLATQIALRIVDLIRQEDLEKGYHLRAQALADLFKVSRAPVNAALKLLSESGIVSAVHNRGYFVEKPGNRLIGSEYTVVNEDEDKTYFMIAEDHLLGRLPERVSENKLMRQYRVSRPRIRAILARAADEGWVARLPGHGWEFLSVLTSSEAYEQAYHFRAEIETTAVMQPSFRVDTAAFRAARIQQLALLDGDILRLSRPQLFKINSEFHEMIVTCSHNQFFVDALKRVNRLRRLMEYRITLDRTRLTRQCREHIELLDLLENEDRKAAAEFLHRHIEAAWQIKKGGTR